jgi:polysaccharide deacetylase 2 family uncharacterized protein YibQ
MSGDKKEEPVQRPRFQMKSLVPQFPVVPHIDLQGLSSKFPLDPNVFTISLGLALAVLAPVVFFAPGMILTSMQAKQAKLAAHHARVDDATAGEEKQVDGGSVFMRPASDFNEREQQAVATNDKIGNEALNPAPIEALEENHITGKIPRIADDGRKPWYVYSRPFDNIDPRPRIGLVIGELGFSRILTDVAITEMPGAVTLAFAAYGTATADWMSRARSHGHETLLSLSMEPLDYPASDPGPGSILTKNSKQANLDRLRNMMAEGTGYVGVTTLSGSRLTSSPDRLQPILTEINTRGMMYLDARLTPLSSGFALSKSMGLPAVDTAFRITPDMSIDEVSYMLLQIEQAAIKEKKIAVMASPSPMVIRKLVEWAQGLAAKGYALAPLTAMATE